MLGEKIRKRRIQLGLSQVHLAGGEMTRAFISLVESGKCNPSPQTLRIIAARLRKPVSYFLGEDPQDNLGEVVQVLTQAEEAIASSNPALALDKVKRDLCEVLDRISGIGCMDLEVRARKALVRCQLRQGNTEEAREELTRVSECLTALKDVQGLAEINREIGNLSFSNEEFSRASQAYERALFYSTGYKTMQSFRVQVLMYLGSTLYRMGKYSQAEFRYRDALQEAESAGLHKEWSEIAMGYGSTLFSNGNPDEAIKWTRRALEKMRLHKDPDYILAKHNLALMESARGNWETAYVTLQECLCVYKADGRIKKSASALEDIARYWSSQGDLMKAEELCWEAIRLLDIEENTSLRGRLYRMLGCLAIRAGDARRARSLLHISAELLRSVKAAAELALTKVELEKVYGALD